MSRGSTMSKTVLVTGASAGVGRSLAHRFARDGFDIVAVARRGDLLDSLTAEVRHEHGRRVLGLRSDLAEPGAAERVYDHARTWGVTVMINNAGLGDWNFGWDVGLDRLHAMIDLNVRALAELSVRFVRDHRDDDAQLINVASAAGYELFVGAVPYSATKFFVTAFTEGIEHDLRAVGARMRAKLLVPGPVDTEFTAVSMSASKLPRREASGVRFHTPDEIADFAHRLYESDRSVGVVDTADMSFRLRDTMHPLGRLPRSGPDRR